MFSDFLAKIESPTNKKRTQEVLSWVSEQFPQLVPEIKWNQPMFTDHGTFIIAFSIAKNHLAVAPEKIVIDKFSKKIKNAGYNHTQQLMQIPWNKEVNDSLLREIIEFNIKDKADCSTFWRK